MPTKNQTAATVIRALIQHWIIPFGAPHQGKCFEAEVVRLLCEHYNIKKSRTTTYNSQGNGECERFNRSLIALLSSLSPAEKTKWPDHLPEVVFCYNDTPHITTGLSPYSLLYGRESRPPLDQYLGIPVSCPNSAAVEYIQRHTDRLTTLHKRALERSKKNGVSSLNKKETCHWLRPGNQVLTRARHFGRHKIKDCYNETPADVLQVPPATGGYFILQYPDGRMQNCIWAQPPLVPPTQPTLRPYPRN